MGSEARLLELPCSESVSASLAFYAPHTRQACHHHDHTQISFLLSGEMLERHPGGEWMPKGFAIGSKPAGLAHENFWGAGGVLVFSIKLRGDGLTPSELEPGWSVTRSPALVLPLIKACIDGTDRVRREEVIADLIALGFDAPEASASPPVWLERAREAIRDQAETIGIAEAAKMAGVHRVRLSSLFRRHYGLPPSLYRLRVLTAHAIARIVTGKEPLTAVAHEAGFCDQAHLTRSVARMTGFPPTRLRALLD